MTYKKGHTKINTFDRMAPVVLFLSSYMPMVGILFIRHILTNGDHLGWGGLWLKGVQIFGQYFGVSVVCIIFVIFGMLGTNLTLKNLDDKMANGINVEVLEISSMNDEPLAYIATYIVPILFQDYSNLSDVVTLTIIFYIIYRLYIRSKLILVNPMLTLKYSIFNIKFKDGDIIRQGVIISKEKYIEEGEIAKIFNIGYQLYYGYKR